MKGKTPFEFWSQKKCEEVGPEELKAEHTSVSLKVLQNINYEGRQKCYLDKDLLNALYLLSKKKKPMILCHCLQNSPW